MKQETKNYLEIVSSIYDTLSKAIEKFNNGRMSVQELLIIVVTVCQVKPMGLILIDGEVEHVTPNIELMHESLSDLFSSIFSNPQSLRSSTCRAALSSLIIGDEEWDYCLNR